MAAKRKFCYDYPRPMVAVDCIALRVREGRLDALLIRRERPPFKGRWALPGGFVKLKESLEESMLRELREETGLGDVPCLIQLGAYGEPRRDPRGRVISVVFIGIVPDRSSEATAGDDAAGASWHPVENLPAKIAFDHVTIIGDALRRLLALGRSSGALFAFLPKRFTADELKEMLRAVYGVAPGANEYLASFQEMGLVRKVKGGRKYEVVTLRNAGRKRAPARGQGRTKR